MGHHTRGRVFGNTMSLPLLPIWMSPFYPLLWSRHSASFQVFFRGNCSICSCRFGCVHGGDEVRIFLWCQFWTAPPWRFWVFKIIITYCPLFPNQWGKSAALYLRVNMIEKVSPVSYLKNETKQKVGIKWMLSLIEPCHTTRSRIWVLPPPQPRLSPLPSSCPMLSHTELGFLNMPCCFISLPLISFSV